MKHLHLKPRAIAVLTVLRNTEVMSGAKIRVRISDTRKNGDDTEALLSEMRDLELINSHSQRGVSVWQITQDGLSWLDRAAVIQDPPTSSHELAAAYKRIAALEQVVENRTAECAALKDELRETIERYDLAGSDCEED
jgi:hypothetical protein